MSTLPLDFPGLQAEAQRLAVEVTSSGLTQRQRWCLKDDERLLTAAFARLLADLTRPESRDRWARLLVAKLGFHGGLTSPGLFFAPAFKHAPACWALHVNHDELVLFSAVGGPKQADGLVVVPDLPLERNKGPEALRAILHAVFRVAP